MCNFQIFPYINWAKRQIPRFVFALQNSSLNVSFLSFQIRCLQVCASYSRFLHSTCQLHIFQCQVKASGCLLVSVIYGKADQCVSGCFGRTWLACQLYQKICYSWKAIYRTWCTLWHSRTMTMTWQWHGQHSDYNLSTSVWANNINNRESKQ